MGISFGVCGDGVSGTESGRVGLSGGTGRPGSAGSGVASPGGGDAGTSGGIPGGAAPVICADIAVGSAATPIGKTARRSRIRAI